jgi:hypothetical protein
MRKLALLAVVVALAASGCQAWTGGLAPAGSEGDAAVGRTSAIYAAVIRQLVTKDHTFGSGPTPFERVFVLDGPVVDFDYALAGRVRPSKPFSLALKLQILEALRDLPPVRFVNNPDAVLVDRRGCPQVRGRGVLISLGPIAKARGEAATVANSLFIACLGGQWLTYVLEPRAGRWRVVDTNGPVVVS